MMGLEPLAHFLEGDFTCLQVTVEALGLDVNIIKAILLAVLQVLHNRVIFAETVIGFVKSDFHWKQLLNDDKIMSILPLSSAGIRGFAAPDA